MESSLHKQVPFSRSLKIFLLYVVLVLIAIFMITPFVWMASTAFKPLADVYIYPPKFLPTKISITNIQEVMDVIPIWRFLANTFYVATVAVLGQLVVCTMAAYAFARLKFPGRDLIFTLYLGTMMLPFAVTMIPLFVLISKIGWQDNYAAIIVPSLSSAYGTFLLRQFFLTFPTELEDAARIDGCGRFRFLYTILVPLSMPALVTLGLFNFLWRWNDFLWPMLVLHSQPKFLIQLGLAFFNGQYASSVHLIMTGATISVIPLLVLFVVAQKYYIQGVVLSGLKG